MVTAEDVPPTTRSSALLGAVTAALLVVAVFVMHGPSADHMLMQAGHGGSSASLMVHSSGHEHRPDMAPTGEVAVADQSATTVVALSPAAAMGMAHSDCVATLRGDSSLAPAGLTAVVSVAAPAAATLGTPMSMSKADRAPPDTPSLERLCISRT